MWRFFYAAFTSIGFVTLVTEIHSNQIQFCRNYKRMKKVLYLVVFLTSTSKLFSQEIEVITQADIISKSIEKNIQVKMALSEANVAQTELLGSQAMYLPNITLSYTYTNTNNPLMAFGSKLNQERIKMEDFNPDYLNNPNSISNFGTKLEVQQPIINMDAVYYKNAGKVKIDALNIKVERTKEYIQFELKKAYMMLQLAYKMLETLDNAKNTAFANKKVVEDYYKNGLIQQSEVLYIDVRISEIESQIQIAKSNIKNASDYIYYLLDENANNKILKPADELTLIANNNIPDNYYSLNENRKDLQAYNKSLEAYSWLIKASKSKYLPRLNAFGSFELYDKNFAQFNANGYLVGLQFSWNIFDGFKAKNEQKKYKAELAKSKTDILQYTKQSQLEFNKTIRQVQDAYSKITFTKKAFEQTKEAYRIRQNRFTQGLEKSADLLSAETLMFQKELSYHQAIFEFNSTYEYYQFLLK